MLLLRSPPKWGWGVAGATTEISSCWVEQVVAVFKLGLLQGFVWRRQLRPWDTGEVVS